MRLARSSLCNALLADGDEDLAAVLAAADLPDVLDTDRDADALAALGLPADDLVALLPAVTGDTAPALSPADMALLERTISDRWAHLVDTWTRP